MVSTPLARSSSAFSMNPGRCFRLQVGVKAPGTANSTTCSGEGAGQGGGAQAEVAGGIVRRLCRSGICARLSAQVLIGRAGPPTAAASATTGAEQQPMPPPRHALFARTCRHPPAPPLTFLPLVRLPTVTSCMLPSASK